MERERESKREQERERERERERTYSERWGCGASLQDAVQRTIKTAINFGYRDKLRPQKGEPLIRDTGLLETHAEVIKAVLTACGRNPKESDMKKALMSLAVSKESKWHLGPVSEQRKWVESASAQLRAMLADTLAAHWRSERDKTSGAEWLQNIMKGVQLDKLETQPAAKKSAAKKSAAKKPAARKPVKPSKPEAEEAEEEEDDDDISEEESDEKDQKKDKEKNEEKGFDSSEEESDEKDQKKDKEKNEEKGFDSSEEESEEKSEEKESDEEQGEEESNSEEDVEEDDSDHDSGKPAKKKGKRSPEHIYGYDAEMKVQSGPVFSLGAFCFLRSPGSKNVERSYEYVCPSLVLGNSLSQP